MNMPTTLVIVALAIIMAATFNDGSVIETLDPQKRQADAGCPSEWHGFDGECYYLAHESRVPYDKADAACRDMDATLAIVHADEEQTFLSDLLEIVPDKPNFGYFIGLTKVSESAFNEDKYIFAWDDGTKLDYTSWAPHKPNNVNGKQDCVIMWADQGGLWNDFWCSSGKAYICQKPKVVCPSDEWHGFHGECYYLAHESRVTYETAVRKCQDMDATLAIVHNEDEQTFLSDLLEIVPEMPNFGYFIGLSKDKDIFAWDDGSKLDYTSWAPNKPNNYGGQQECVIMWANQGGLWNDFWCLSSMAYICQKN